MRHAPVDRLTRCPFCKKQNDLVSAAPKGRSMPRDGDFSFCFECGEWAVFDSGWSGGVRKPTFADYQEIVADPRMQMMRGAWLEVIEVKDRGNGRRFLRGNNG